MPKILAIPGSLRSNSASNQILNAVVSLYPKSLEFEIFDGLGELPHFNDPTETPLTVAAFREKIKHADAVLVELLDTPPSGITPVIPPPLQANKP